MNMGLVGQEFKVLDDGFIRVIDIMGSDESVVQAARISYGRGTKRVSQDSSLIRYLLRHKHTTPFEMCEIKLHVRAPMDCWRQWIRHRTASVNEYSTRYSEAIDSNQLTKPAEWRAQSTTNRQGSGQFLPMETGYELSKKELDITTETRRNYQDRLKLGVSREQARKDLPLSTYTEAYWKIDLHNLLHFLWLRMNDHAQVEISEYAKIIGHSIVASWCPITWGAFLDYELNGMRLTRLDIDILHQINGGHFEKATDLAESFGWLRRRESGRLAANRERSEFEQKLARLGIKCPWRIA